MSSNRLRLRPHVLLLAGDLDLAVGGANGTIIYYENTGTAESPEYNAGVSPFADVDVYANSAPAFCDLDGDNKVDLLVGGSKIHPDLHRDTGLFDGGFYYYENTGSVAPEFVARTGRADPLPFQLDGSISRPTLGDLDGDNDLDLIVGRSDGSLAYYKNVGSATNPAFVELSGFSNPVDDLTVWTTNDDYYYDDTREDEGTAPTLIDFDGDGDLDLIVGRDDGKLHYFRNEGSATAPQFSPVELFLRDAAGDITVALFSFPAVGDIDGDGDKKEPMKKAAKDKKEKDPQHEALVDKTIKTLETYLDLVSKQGDEKLSQATENVRKVFGMKEKAKPDYIDIDKDGDKKEPMKKAVKDKEKKSSNKKMTMDQKIKLLNVGKQVREKAKEYGVQPSQFLGYLVAKDPQKFGALAKLESIIDGQG
mgnify:CR=1 FL=1